MIKQFLVGDAVSGNSQQYYDIYNNEKYSALVKAARVFGKVALNTFIGGAMMAATFFALSTVGAFFLPVPAMEIMTACVVGGLMALYKNVNGAYKAYEEYSKNNQAAAPQGV